MNCPNCGNMLPDGSMFCGNCGAQLGQQMQQPNMQFQQPNMQFQQPQMQYQQMQQPQMQQGMQQGMYGQQQMGMGYPQGYVAPRPKMVRVPKYVKPSVCRIVGAVLILLASILPVWLGAYENDLSYSDIMNGRTSMHGYYGGCSFFATGGGVLVLWGILLLLTALALLFFEIDLPQIRNVQGAFHSLPGARFYLPGFALLLLILGTFAHSLETNNIGWGWWLCLIGILLCCVSPVVDLIKGNR